MIETTIAGFEPILSELAQRLPEVNRADESGHRDLSELIEAMQANFDQVAEMLREVLDCIAAGEPMSLEGLTKLQTLCYNFAHLHERLVRAFVALEAAGWQVEGWDRLAEVLDRIALMLRPVAQRLETAKFRLPAEPPTGSPSTEPPAKTVRLPDPYFETDEMSAPFDLPRPGVWVPVKTRPGPIRLPDPMFDDEETPEP